MFGKGYKTLQGNDERLLKLQKYMKGIEGYEVRLYSSDRSFKNEVKTESNKSAEDFLKDYELQENIRKNLGPGCWNLGLLPLYVFKGKNVVHIRGSQEALDDAIFAAEELSKSQYDNKNNSGV